MDENVKELPITYKLRYPIELKNSVLSEIVFDRLPTWGAVKAFPIGRPPTAGDFLPIAASMTAKITTAIFEKLSAPDAFKVMEIVSPFTADLEEPSKPSE